MLLHNVLQWQQQAIRFELVWQLMSLAFAQPVSKYDSQYTPPEFIRFVVNKPFYYETVFCVLSEETVSLLF